MPWAEPILACKDKIGFVTTRRNFERVMIEENSCNRNYGMSRFSRVVHHLRGQEKIEFYTTPDEALTDSRPLLGVKELVLALFLTAGQFKSDPRVEWLPIDLTLLIALATAAFVVWVFLKGQLRLPRSLFILLGFYLLFLPALFWTDWNSYAIEKTVRFFTLTLLATVAPLFLIRSRNELFRFLNALGLLGAIMTIDALLTLITQGEVVAARLTTNQLTAFGATSIGFGRVIGTSLLWAAVLGVERRLNYLFALGVIGALAIVLLGSGSRGPLFGTLTAFVLMLVLHKRGGASRMARVLMIAVVGGIVVRLSLPLIPANSLLRIETFLEGTLGSSELSRLHAFTLAWPSIQENPLGIGLGGFATHNLWIHSTRQYPHNILLETLLEGGWLAGMYLIFLVLLALRRVHALVLHKAWAPEAMGLFAILCFFLMNVMVSGDLNDNKALFALIGIGIILKERDNYEA